MHAKTLFLQAVLTSLALAEFPWPPRKWTVGQEVDTSSGLLTGQKSDWQPEVSEYLGIPFAEPPIGDLRWAAPRRYRSDDAQNATQFSPSCPANVASPPGSNLTYGSVRETIGGVLGQAGDTFSEDCLTVNVWTKPQTGARKKPVLIWIYGGGFNTGNSRSPAYNGAALANNYDVVVVTMNYRINIFGFPGAPFLPDINLGILDQRLAIEWARDNIEEFGGDPDQMILFGQSAGGGSTDMHAYAYPWNPIVKGYIPMSGSVSVRSPSTQSQGSSWYATSKALGCGGAEPGEADSTLECMRKKPFQEILNAIKASTNPLEPAGFTFFPSADGKIVFDDYAKRQEEGKFARLPVLVGATNDEGGLAAITGPRPGPGGNSTGGLSGLSILGCGPHAAALARRNHGIPTWRYLYAGEWPNQDIGSEGAWHGADIGIVFGNTEYITRRPDTEEQKKLIKTMSTAWTTFAKNPGYGLTALGYPLYTPELPTVIRFGGENSSEVAFETRTKYDAPCEALE
ncbi:alpha/beta-hydrolase [Eremomyces bilateralis CBS 781.70]|uniref:Carboxylic ester hydrolase n=1 Tax=Eremomyces bilateralis CBS 781.70 TaxID=1392243 RepID=A0A6G1G5W8_9PEZI|nr:alpha/beta-hydrolase [Eremomyces bilateralis CBS 781.70]KAF1813270.1 alpha/beta-hydrolase [Eremomyces bilateralis CBS 781.70]